MTDNEIIKAFECYKNYPDDDITRSCEKTVLLKKAYYLMCSQQAEIDRLKDENKKCLLIISSDTRRLKDEYERLKKAKAAAIEKFETKLKERQFSFIDDGWVEKYVPVQAIDDVKKELLGDTDA